MELIITAVYTAPYKRVTINFMMNNEHEFTACGEVSDDELMALVAAEGADVAGWECELQ
ncbi:MAG TPA: hypothetical protein PLN96_15395 [Zoogloea sp.]|uniref:hypothetical protein n=1 Tax=Zoogloea sp. TaxID=49181 RepID=UPI002C0E2A8E|nr:hypothetical protein [Zoogloea sp.]HNI49255.1 hypothetical protein [Zoogloea sp.]